MRLSLLLVIALVIAACTDPAASIQPNSLKLPQGIAELKQCLDTASAGSVQLEAHWKLYKKYRNNYPESALTHLAELRNVAMEVDNATFLGLSRYGEGMVYRRTGEFNKALRSYLRAIDVFEKDNDIARLADSYNNIGTILMYAGGYAQAIDYLKKAEAMYEAIGDKAYLIDVLTNLAFCHYEGVEGDYQQAYALLYKAIQTQNSIDRGNMGQLYFLNSKLGVASFKAGQYAKAIKHYHTALPYAKDLADGKSLLADLYFNLAEAHILMGPRYFDQAKQWIAKAEGLPTNQSVDGQTVTMRLNIAGMLKQRMGLHEEALAIFGKAISTANKTAVNKPLQKTLGMVEKSHGALNAAGVALDIGTLLAYEAIEDRQAELEKVFQTTSNNPGLVKALTKEIDLHEAELEARTADEQAYIVLQLSGFLVLFMVCALVAYRRQQGVLEKERSRAAALKEILDKVHKVVQSHPLPTKETTP